MTSQLATEEEATKIEALNWISTLLNRHRAKVIWTLQAPIFFRCIP